MGLVVSVLFAAVCAYVLAHFSAGGGRTAALAVLERRTVKNCVTLEGIAVRRESVVPASSAALYAAEDGARLAASGGARTGGSAVFYSAVDGYEYLSPSALEDFSAGTQGGSSKGSTGIMPRWARPAWRRRRRANMS